MIDKFFLRRYSRFPEGKQDILVSFIGLFVFIALDLALILHVLPKYITYLTAAKTPLMFLAGLVLFIILTLLVSHLISFVHNTFKDIGCMNIKEKDLVSFDWEGKKGDGVVERIERKPLNLKNPVYIIKTKSGKILKIPMNGMLVDLRNITKYVKKR